MTSVSGGLEKSPATLRRAVTSRMVGGIYVIVDPGHTRGRSVLDVAMSAIDGGAAAIQLRDKFATRTELLRDASAMAAMCHNSEVVFIVNDYPQVAAASGAHGVHVGQGDVDISGCRDVLLDRQIVGRSNALVSEALESVALGADYIAVGSIFPTTTKSDTRPAGLETLRIVAGESDVPVVAIGGITHANVGSVADAGADVVCVATAVTEADDPAVSVYSLSQAFSEAQRKRRKS